jgi:uncharacterized membrane protein YfcA
MLLIPIIFLIGIFNGFINVTSGGAGLINTPLLLALGLSPYNALATTKFITIGSGISGSMKYHREKVFRNHIFILWVVLVSFIGGIAGAAFTFLVNALALEWSIIIIAASIILLTIFRKQGEERAGNEQVKPLHTMITMVGLFIIAIYGGSIGMGAGIAVIALLVHYTKFSYLQSSAVMTFFTLGAIIGSTLLFLFKGAVNFEYGVPLFLGSVVGGWIGAHTAVKKGNKLIKWMTISITVVLIGKVIMDLV